MADLYILLPARPGETPVYAWRSAGDWETANVAPGERFGRGENAVAFVPGTAVTLHHADIVARKPAEARQVALFALEDELAEPVDQVHAAPGPAVAETARREILIASRTDMRTWTAWLAEAGYPDADIVAPQSCLPDRRMAVAAPDEILFRVDETVFALDIDTPGDIVQSLAPDHLEDVYGEGLAQALGIEATGPALTSRKDWLIYLSGLHHEASGAGLSLRQGDFGVRHTMTFEGLARWRVAGALAAACALLWLGSVWMETSALRNQANDLRQQTGQLVAAVTPEANGQLPAALESLRRSTRAGASALRPTYATAALYEAISPVDNAEIRSLRYDAGNGRLTATVVFDSYSQADMIGQRLEESGLAVSLGEARQSGNRVMGELVIEGATS
ncbi:type II secretion system protein GspL [Henriciella sp.]|uniref:type II secretion system protein GspL n=1 Tax=Henriciella sp. TaxID=1968823 RepID=UPI002623D0C8|nr:type II secretion system protein GspL [Henriciella sp.]